MLVVGIRRLWDTDDYVGREMRYTAKVDEKGRLSVPRRIRELAGWANGERVSVTVEGHDLRVSPARDQAARLRGFVRRLEPDRDLVAEVIAERREEAAREEASEAHHVA
jgi:AbrB family looped-hinge helix DNA binding protein